MSTAAAAAASDAVLLGDNEASGSSSSSLLAKPRRSHTLMTLPPEILDSIAYFCAITTYHHVRTSSECSNCLDGDLDMCTNCQLDYSSPAPAYATPPANVRALLLTCRRAHALLNTQANPRLYARLFKIKFDVAAIKRRFGSQAVSSRSLTMELQRRCVCLKRIKEAVEQGRLRPRAEEETNDAQYEAQWLAESNSQMLENLWLAYMMMVENDGLNSLQLRWAHIDGYLMLHHSQEMLEAAVQPGYPPDTPDRCLALHLSHLLTDPATLAKETRDESEEKLFVLRPFVFAAHKFDAYYAPWTNWTLPIEGNVSAQVAATEAPTAATSSLPADHKGKGPATAGTAAESEGSRRKLEREESMEATQLEQSRDTPPPHNPFLADLRPRPREVEITHCGTRLRLAPPILSHAACFSFFAKVERDPAVIGLTTVVDEADLPAAAGFRANRNPLLFRSADHDKDVARLLACSDPYTSPGFKPLFHAGDFEGAWEGRFSFFDFDSYREMLAGRMRSLYEGPFGEQPQVWKIKEHIVKIDYAHKEGGKGTLLNAGYLPKDDEPTDALDYPAEGAEGATGMDADPGRSRTTSYNASASPSASSRYAGPSSSAFGAASSSRSSQWGSSTAGSSSATGGLTDLHEKRRQGHLKNGMPDWHKYPSFDDDEPEENDDDRYEILLSGTGHSAWGRFILRGRVRAWDGMMIMTKEYRPDGRGRWLYRGYAVAGGRLVGRWRDTFTPDNMSGYEGTFLLSRRDNS